MWMPIPINKGAKNDMKVSDANALKGHVIFPKVDEEKSIVEYFTDINQLITLHQDEYVIAQYRCRKGVFSHETALYFHDRYIEVKAYKINTILAEKIDTILSRNISNTRAGDLYDVYILLTTRPSDINKDELKQAIIKKAEERNSIVYVENYQKYLTDVLESEDVQKIWDSYKNKYLYAKDILFSDIINCIEEVLK
jgi:hypothetical protein